MALFKVVCTNCGWVAYREKDGVFGRKCPECQQPALTQERHRYEAKAEEPS